MSAFFIFTRPTKVEKPNRLRTDNVGGNNLLAARHMDSNDSKRHKLIGKECQIDDDSYGDLVCRFIRLRDLLSSSSISFKLAVIS